MGVYVNLINMKKEDWLLIHAEPFSYRSGWGDVKDGYLPVCLIDNVLFTAAGICYSEKEFDEFKCYDGRKKTWFLVEILKLLEVAPDLREHIYLSAK